MIEIYISAAGLLLALGGTFAGWLASRRSELRRDEVLAWVNQVIACLQSIVLLLREDRMEMPEADRIDRLEELGLEASILLEQGRLFFRNQPHADHGLDKEPAYRGIRPLILDQILVAHQLACEWRLLDAADRKRGFDIALFCLKRFVSLAQQEVGRDRAASAYAALTGEGASLALMLAEMQAGRGLDGPLDLKAKGSVRRWQERRKGM